MDGHPEPTYSYSAHRTFAVDETTKPLLTIPPARERGGINVGEWVRMGTSAVENATRIVGRQYFATRSIFEQLLVLLHKDTALHRISLLFDNLSMFNDITITDPYSNLTQNIRISFDKKDVSSCKIAATEAVDCPGFEGRKAIQIVPAAAENATWLGVELSLPWEQLRQASSVSATLFCKSSQPTVGWTQIYYYDDKGNHHEAITEGDGTFSLSTELVPARIECRYVLSSDLVIDFDREPVISFFFNPRVTSVDLYDIFVDFLDG